MDNLSLKPRIKSFLYVIPTENYVLFRGRGVFKVQGKNHREFIEILLPLLDGRYTVEEILEILADYRREDILASIDLLFGQGLIEDASTKVPKKLSGRDIVLYSDNLEYFSRFSEKPYDCQANLKKARLAIIGEGSIGLSIAKKLQSAGVGRISLVEERAEETGFVGGIQKNTYKKLSNRIKVKLLKGDIDDSEVSRIIGTNELVICACDNYKPSLYDLVNKYCIENDVPWIPVYCIGDNGFIGPLTDSKESACYNCSKIRILNNSEHLEEDRLFYQYLEKNYRGNQRVVPSFYLDILSNFAALQAVDFISKVKTPSITNNILIIDMESLSSELHGVIKVPNCSYCSNAFEKREKVDSYMLEQETKMINMIFKNGRESTSDSNSLVDELVKLVDDKTGIIKRVSVTSSSSYLNSFGQYGHVSIGSSENRYRTGRDFIFSTGTDANYENAKLAALVEAIERYCCEFKDGRNFIKSRYEHVKEISLDPTDVVLFSERQYSKKNFPWNRFSEDLEINWVAGLNLMTKKSVLVPADFVYTSVSKERICNETSNGAAAHSNAIEAILGGIFEIIERDSLMIMWFNKLPMPKIKIASLPKDIVEIVKSVKDHGFDVLIQNITSDIDVPAFCTYIVNKRKKKPALFTGAGCHLSPIRAINKGLKEAIRSLSHHLTYPDQANKVERIGFGKLRSPEDHGNLYFFPSMLKHLDFVLSTDNYQDLDLTIDQTTGSPQGDLFRCVRMFKNMKFEILTVDCSSPDVRNSGLYVMKVLIPGMHPIAFGMNNQRLGGHRLYNVPKALGYTDRPAIEEEINLIPHFFA